MERIKELDLQMQNFILNVLKKKKIIKRNQVLKNSPDPENYWRGHQQSYNFFLVFVDFRTLPDNSGKPKSFDSKQKN